MAFAISRRDIERLKSVSYEEVRLTLKSGDLIFASGDYLVSKAIQKVTHSPWSHVAIIIRVEEIDRILLLESVEDMGVRIVPLSKYLHTYENNRPYKGKIIVWTAPSILDMRQPHFEAASNASGLIPSRCE